MAPELLLVERPRRFPEAVEAELARRRLDLVATASGRVLDLDRADARDELRAAIAAPAVDAAYDTVLDVSQLVRFPDLAAAVDAVDRLLAPGGQLLALEAIAHPTFLSLLQDSLWARHPAVAGFHVARDLPAALRTTSLVAVELERFTMPTVVYPLRRFVAVTARRARIVAEDTEVGR